MDQKTIDRIALKSTSVGGFQDIKIVLKSMKRQLQSEKKLNLQSQNGELKSDKVNTSNKDKNKQNNSFKEEFFNQNSFIVADTPKAQSQQLIKSFGESDDQKFRSTNKSIFRSTSDAFKHSQRQIQPLKSQHSIQCSIGNRTQSKFYIPQTPSSSYNIKKANDRLNNLSIGGDIFSPQVPSTASVFTSFRDIIQKQHKNVLSKFLDMNVTQQDKIKQQLFHNSAQMNLIKQQLETERINSFENILYAKQYTDKMINNSITSKKIPQIDLRQKQLKVNNSAPMFTSPYNFQQQMNNLPTSNGIIQPSTNEIDEPENQNPSVDYQFHWEKITDYTSDLKPEFREGATLIEYKQNFFLYGGFGFELFNSIYQFKLNDYKWKKVETLGVGAPSLGRFGHTAHVYRNQMVVFGGGSEYSSKMKNRLVMNELWMLNLDILEWKLLRTTGDYVEPRRNHAACIVGNNYFVHGGVGSQERYLNQMNVLSFDKGRWKSQTLKIDEQGVAFHQMVPIFAKYIKYQSTKSEKMGQIVGSKNKFKIKEEGIYCFGGKQGNEKIRGKLMILKLDQKDMPVEWIIPETAGQNPPARFHHSMFYNYNVKGIVLFGGTNDEANQAQHVFQDVWVLQLTNLNWVQVNVSGQQNRYRFAHSFATIDERMFVFGGASNNSYTDCELYVLEMNKEKAIYKRNNPVRDMATRQQSLERLEDSDAEIVYQQRNKNTIRRSSGVKTFLRPPTKDYLKTQIEDQQVFMPFERARKNTILSAESSPRASIPSLTQKFDITLGFKPKQQSIFSPLPNF